MQLFFCHQCVENSIGILIKGRLDKSGSGLLYTNAYVSRHKAMIRGTFSAVTRPTPVGPILLRGNYNENLFHCEYVCIYVCTLCMYVCMCACMYVCL